MSFGDDVQQARPPVFASAEIRVRALPVHGGDAAVQLSVAGTTIVLSEQEARALCTQLRDALGVRT